MNRNLAASVLVSKSTVAGLLLLVLLLSACGTFTQELDQEDSVSAKVTVSIKASLVEADRVDAAAVLVELNDQTVVLSGFVASEEEAAEVIRIAEQEAGEYTIQNELVVK